MDPLLFGPVDTVLMPVIEYLVLGLVLVNLVTRFLAHRAHLRGAEENGAEGITQYTPHVAANLALVLATFYYMTVDLHYGALIAVLVVALVLTDFFEVESRRVEARTEKPIEQPKAAIGLSVVVLIFVSYVALFFVIEPLVRVVF